MGTAHKDRLTRRRRYAAGIAAIRSVHEWLIMCGQMVVSASIVAGCGPSYHVIYDGDARFEHCYALDENTAVGLADRCTCWGDWIDRRTEAQSHDRVEYALWRYQSLSSVGEGVCRGTVVIQARNSAASAPSVPESHTTAPGPTSPFQGPPKMCTAP